MNKYDYFTLLKFSQTIKFHPYSMQIIMKALEFYLIVIRQQHNSNLIDTKEYDNMYYDIYLLYNTFLYRIAEIPGEYREYTPINIPLYKRINNREFIEKALKRYKTNQNIA